MSKYDHDDDLNTARALVGVVILGVVPWLIIGLYLWAR